MRKCFITAAALLVSSAAAALAHGDAGDHGVAPSSFMAELGASHVGDVAGHPAFEITGTSMLWLHLPDGLVMGGFLFDDVGLDRGAELIGVEPMDVYSTLGLHPPAAIAEAGSGEADNPRLGEDEAMRRAIGAIAELPDAEKRQQLLGLLLAMNEARTPEDFAKGVAAWGSAATQQGAVSVPELSPITPESYPPEPLEAMPEIGTLDMHSGMKRDLDDTAKAEAADRDEGADDRSAELLAALEEGFWISIGHASAPAVYMVLDPACPYCAKAVANLKDDIEDGRIELRVLMAPLISQRSIDLIAGIMQADNPAEALWNHELEYARNGASTLAPGAFSELERPVIDALLANRALAEQYQLPGVPFFAWRQAGGVSLLSGVPEAGHFNSAEQEGR